MESGTFKIEIEPNKTVISIMNEKFKDWDFFWNIEKMLLSSELDLLQEKLKNKTMPEMMFGHNRFIMVHTKSNLAFEVSPLTMLDSAVYELQEKKLNDKNNLNSLNGLNCFYFKPKEVKVQFYEKWKNLKVENEDVKRVAAISDWTYSSGYMGEFLNFQETSLFNYNKQFFQKCNLNLKNNNLNNNNNNNNNNDSNSNDSLYKLELTDEEIPVNRLGRDNPILKFIEIPLFDDELCDNGLAQGSFR